MDKVIFVPAGPRSWGSSRMRAFWVAENMPGAELAIAGNQIGEGDVYIFQKVFDLDVAVELRQKGNIVIWDVCDPMWWFSQCWDIVKNCDGVVLSNVGLKMDLLKSFEDDRTLADRSTVIKDRLDFSHFTKQREHVDFSYRFIWFGVAVNRIALYGALPLLERLRSVFGIPVELTIFDDRPEIPLAHQVNVPVSYRRWELDYEVETLSSHDVALLPRYPGAWGFVKSDNKRITAAACGLPIVRFESAEMFDREMQIVVSKDVRERIVKQQNHFTQTNYDIGLSVAEWKSFIEKVKAKKESENDGS